MYLQLDQISVQYAGAPRPAVHHVSLGLRRGQIGALLGPSGCGKTTLLRAVAGLETLQAGRIVLDGRPVSEAATGLHLDARERRVGMVFQDYALFPHMTASQNVAFGLHGLSRVEQRERVAQMLDLVGLGGAARRYPHQLSGGQQQRIALARALAPQPRLLLMDEPFSSLDVDLRERLAQEVRAILKQTGTTALFVTHDQLEAFALADEVGVMQHGTLDQWDEPYALYHRPATRFVATFVGHGVFTPGKVSVDARGSRVMTPLGELADPQECPLPDASGRCEVLLRADDIVHDDDSPVKARIQAKAFRGSEFLYTLQLVSGEQVLAHVPSHHDHAIGEWIGVRAQVDHVVTFPPAPGPGG